MPGRIDAVVGPALLVLALSACATTPPAPAATPSPDRTAVRTSAPPEPSKPPEQVAPREMTSAPSSPASRARASADTSTPARPDTLARPDHAPRMVRATMRIPAIGIGAVPVVGYRGTPDDGPGTRIQNRGVAASPVGPRGGVGPGQVGNYIVTAHRTTTPAPFADLPSLHRGEHVFIRAGGRVFDYRVTRTRSTSFRSPRSLARQAAAVPGRLGVAATRARITLSTCATPEDHARGNYWSDEFGNPEHRIDKIGVLVDVRRVRP